MDTNNVLFTGDIHACREFCHQQGATYDLDYGDGPATENQQFQVELVTPADATHRFPDYRIVPVGR
jgi:hypothetical protein